MFTHVPLVSAVVAVCAISCWAQTSGSLSGTVRDRTGASIAGAQLTVVNVDTAEERKLTTTESGSFLVAVLHPGLYRVLITATGFQQNSMDAVAVKVTETTILDVTLQVGVDRENISVSASPTLLQTGGPQLGRVVDSYVLSQLPLATRNFTQLLSLSPGTATYLPDSTGVGRNTQAISVNGARVTQNDYVINGAASTLGTNNAILIAVPAPETIEEFKVQTSLFDAAYGHAGGGNIQILTRSGTNALHGELYEYLRNDALDANDTFLNGAGVERSVLRRNVFGATLGGPLRRDRAFFFISYQGSRETNAASLINSISSNVLVAPGLTDDRSATTLLAVFHPVLPDKKPATSIDSAALALLNAKLPNGTYLIPTPASNGRFTASNPSSFQEDQFNTNFDYVFGPRDSIAAKFFFSNTSQFLALPSFRGTGANVPGFGSDAIFNNRVASVRHVHTFRPTVVNEFSVGYLLNRNNTSEREPIRDGDVGIARANALAYPGLPLIRIGQPAGGIVFGAGPQVDSLSAPATTTAENTLVFVRGHHNLRAGGDFRYSLINFYIPAFAHGQIDFSDFNSFLAGNVRTSTLGSGIVGRSWRAFDYNFFVQDDWHVSSRLTVDLGLRYELDLPPTDTRGRLATFDPALYQPRMQSNASGPIGPPVGGFIQAGNALQQFSVIGLPRRENSLLHSIDPHDFAPRVGVAVSVTKNVVLRGGYGLFYSRPTFQYASMSATLPPFYALGVQNNGHLADPFLSLPAANQFPTFVPGVALAGTAFDPDLHTPYLHQFNLTAQYEFSGSWLLEAGYVGTRGRRLFRQVGINEARLASTQSPITNAVTGAVITTNTVENAQLRAPMQGVAVNGFFLNRSDAQSSYNSLQASLVRHSARLQLEASYTFAKSIDDASGAGGGAGISGIVNTGAVGDTGNVLGNQLDRHASRAVSDFNRKHRFVANYVWELPAPSFATRSAAKYLFDGWSTSGILTVMSGLPIDVVDTGSGALYGLAGGSSPLARPSFAPGASCASAQQNIPAGYFFNPFAFRSPVVLAGQPIPSSGGTAIAFASATDSGDIPRNCLTGPHQADFDFGIARSFRFGESSALSFRADIFNAFNHPNLANPISNLNAVTPSGGNINANGTVTAAGNFGRIISTSSNPRIVQLSVHLRF